MKYLTLLFILTLSINSFAEDRGLMATKEQTKFAENLLKKCNEASDAGKVKFGTQNCYKAVMPLFRNYITKGGDINFDIIRSLGSDFQNVRVRFMHFFFFRETADIAGQQDIPSTDRKWQLEQIKYLYKHINHSDWNLSFFQYTGVSSLTRTVLGYTVLSNPEYTKHININAYHKWVDQGGTTRYKGHILQYMGDDDPQFMWDLIISLGAHPILKKENCKLELVDKILEYFPDYYDWDIIKCIYKRHPEEDN